VGLFGRKRSGGERTRIFFATDLHGSETCFRKWLNAAEVYDARVLVLGGDVTGKIMVPFVEEPEGYRAEIHGEVVHARDEQELEKLRSQVRMMGRYDVLLTPEEEKLLADPDELSRIFDQAIRESLQRWVALIDERIGDRQVAVTTMLGNDDTPDFADILRTSGIAPYAEDAPVELPGGYEMISVGFSTPTPWHTPRELSEEDLAERIEAQAAQLSDPSRAVFNLHCPPLESHLDQATKLDDELRPVTDAGGPVMIGVGSRATREAIERHQPLLGLHGHVHESPGNEKIGTTICVNPGSDYGDGILRGAILDLEPERGVRTWQIVQG
jgi:Icc-related predicted phosphoesterase